MSKEFQTVALVGRIDDPRVAEPMAALAQHLTKAGTSVIANASIAGELGVEAIDESAIAEAADLVVAVGGDGTLLYAAELSYELGRPLLGVNRGRLGFLADISPSEMLTGIDNVLCGDYSQESRLVLKATVSAQDGSLSSAIALNDVVIQRRETGRMVDIETRIDGRFINTHSGDGLIVATPTGSTAYALSCGGPIIEPGLSAVVMVPICPHTLSDRPIVVPSSHAIDVIHLPRGDTKAEVVIDGRSIGELVPDGSVQITEAEQKITLLHPPGYDYYEILRSKLHWGRDSRMRNAATETGD